jgi:mono/diheme cytochrome c family protein
MNQKLPSNVCKRRPRARVGFAPQLAVATCVILWGTVATASEGFDASRAKQFMAEHCVSCHGPDKQKGKLRLDNLALLSKDPSSAGVWTEVMDNINAGEMPPPDEPQPPAAARQQFAQWVAGSSAPPSARRAARAGGPCCGASRAPSTPTRSRPAAHELPARRGAAGVLAADGRVDGFDKVSAALTIDPSLLDKYYEVAQRVAQSAVVRGPVEFPTHRARFELEDTAKRQSIRYQCAEPGFKCREHDVMLMDGGTRSFDDLFYPGPRPKRVPSRACTPSASAPRPTRARAASRSRCRVVRDGAARAC